MGTERQALSNNKRETVRTVVGSTTANKQFNEKASGRLPEEGDVQSGTSIF